MRWSLVLAMVVACDGASDDTSSDPVDSADTLVTGTDSEVVSDDTGCTPGTDADNDGSPCELDCDDADPARYPGAPEACNGVDDDCDDQIPDADPSTCAACDAAGLWQPLREAVDDAARLELLQRAVEDYTWCPGDYSGTTTFLFTELDKVVDEGQTVGLVEGVYTGVQVSVGDEKPDHTIMNTEHTWPKSLGGGKDEAECDLNHLFPTDSDANNTRANYPLGVVTEPADWSQGGSILGGGVFEPRDVHKGAAARAMFYMAFRYDHLDLTADEIALFRSWSLDHPVTEAEQDRALAIAERQGGINPFVVCPTTLELVAPAP